MNDDPSLTEACELLRRTTRALNSATDKLAAGRRAAPTASLVALSDRVTAFLAEHDS